MFRPKLGRLMNDEYKRIWQDAVVA